MVFGFHIIVCNMHSTNQSTCVSVCNLCVNLPSSVHCQRCCPFTSIVSTRRTLAGVCGSVIWHIQRVAPPTIHHTHQRLSIDEGAPCREIVGIRWRLDVLTNAFDILFPLLELVGFAVVLCLPTTTTFPAWELILEGFFAPPVLENTCGQCFVSVVMRISQSIGVRFDESIMHACIAPVNQLP